jgi:hypothetical protein
MIKSISLNIRIPPLKHGFLDLVFISLFFAKVRTFRCKKLPGPGYFQINMIFTKDLDNQ